MFNVRKPYKLLYPKIIIDVENNKYNIVKIGNQLLTMENWRCTKYMCGTSIVHVTDNTAWSNSTTPAYCWHSGVDTDELKAKYGALYNWYVVDPENPHDIAPDGWRVPTDEDWDVLRDYLIANGYNWDGTTTGNKIGKALASSGGEWGTHATEGRVGNNQGSNNSSGFSALPGGCRGSSGYFYTQSLRGNWWSATEDAASNTWLRILDYHHESLLRVSYDNKGCGFSVRLVKDI